MATPPTILIVDDHSDTLEMYAIGLSWDGYLAVRALDVESAVRTVKTHRPHAVVTDIQLPDGDGWELIRTLKADPHSKDIPVVVLTGRMEPIVGVTAKQLGCAALLTKPCPPHELSRVLRALLPANVEIA